MYEQLPLTNGRSYAVFEIYAGFDTYEPISLGRAIERIKAGIYLATHAATPEERTLYMNQVQRLFQATDRARPNWGDLALYATAGMAQEKVRPSFLD